MIFIKLPLLFLGTLFLSSCVDVKPINSPIIEVQEIPKDPVLRPEVRMHTTTVASMDSDAKNQFLVTASHDKTVRVWELSYNQIKLAKTLRPPIGEGEEGKIYAVAVSPNSQHIACGGWTGLSWQGVASVYIFARENGQMIHRITGLPYTVTYLTYSQDGRYLLVALGGGKGIRVYRKTDYSLVFEDLGYQGQCFGADFDFSGRLVTVAYDGYIRLYDRDWSLLQEVSATNGQRPYSVKFSPGGKKIALGFADTPQVEVRSGEDLSLLYSPSTNGIEQGDLACVTWSRSGNSLYAAGGYWDENRQEQIIRRWSEQGKGNWQDLGASGNTIHCLLSLKNSDLAFAASDSFGVLDAYGRKKITQLFPVADYRDGEKDFLVSEDGFTLQFRYDWAGKHRALLKVRESISLQYLEQTKLEQGKSLQANLKKAQTKSQDISEWKNKRSLQWQGRPLLLNKGERSRSFTLTQRGFLLGTDYFLRSYDKQGAELWKSSTEGIVWGVNVSGNGRLALASLSDGTIRWYRMQDGQELLAFFPYNDEVLEDSRQEQPLFPPRTGKKHWVLWTPQGYHQFSLGGNPMMGWHKNNVLDQEADFLVVPKVYHRPDIIAQALSEKGVEKDQLEYRASEEIPPRVEIIFPQENQEIQESQITLKYTLESYQGEEITSVKILIDGKVVEAKEGLKTIEGALETRTAQITLPSRNCKISVIARNRYPVDGLADVNIKWAGKYSRPDLYILAIGVGQYEDPELPPLRFANNDANDLVELMKKQEQGLYEKVVIRTLLDEEATQKSILKGLDWIRSEITSRDVAMIFFSGHGMKDARDDSYYFLPADSKKEELLVTAVSYDHIKNAIFSIAGKALVFVDSCYSGNVLGAKNFDNDITFIIQELAQAENGVVAFTSSTGKQISYEDPKWGNGAFTKALLEGLRGERFFGKRGEITVNMLELYISQRVKELTEGRQTPASKKPDTVADFTVAIKEEFFQSKR